MSFDEAMEQTSKVRPKSYGRLKFKFAEPCIWIDSIYLSEYVLNATWESENE